MDVGRQEISCTGHRVRAAYDGIFRNKLYAELLRPPPPISRCEESLPIQVHCAKYWVCFSRTRWRKYDRSAAHRAKYIFAGDPATGTQAGTSGQPIAVSTIPRWERDWLLSLVLGFGSSIIDRCPQPTALHFQKFVPVTFLVFHLPGGHCAFLPLHLQGNTYSRWTPLHACDHCAPRCHTNWSR